MEWTYFISFCFGSVILCAVGYWLIYCYNFFRGQPIPTLRNWLFIGSTGSLWLQWCTVPDFVKTIYDRFPKAKMVGMLYGMTPVYLMRDLSLIKSMHTDYNYISNVSDAVTFDHPNLIASMALSSLGGQQWKSMRATLTPAFSSERMKQMYGLILECCESLVVFYREQGPREYDVQDLFSRLINDVIASCAFGTSVDSTRDRNNVFYENGRKVMDLTGVKNMLKQIGFRMSSPWMSKFGIDRIRREQSNYFRKLFSDAVKVREAKNFVRPDMIHMLTQVQQGTLVHSPGQKNEQFGIAAPKESNHSQAVPVHNLSENEMVGQCLSFFLDGFDTVLAILSFMAYELAINSDVQRRLQHEIEETHQLLHGNRVSCETLLKMKYLDMVLSETLRKWPPHPVVRKECARHFTIHENDGFRMTIDPKSCIWIPIYALHRDPRYFPDPEKFEPQRFNDEYGKNIKQGTFLPFGMGPRCCLGRNFATIEIKCIMYHLLLNFSFKIAPNTTLPLKLRKGFSVLKTETPIILKLSPKK